jgi:hypothetical protein
VNLTLHLKKHIPTYRHSHIPYIYIYVVCSRSSKIQHLGLARRNGSSVVREVSAHAYLVVCSYVGM